MNCHPTRVSVSKFLTLGMALWLGACADSPCPEGLTHAGGQCVSSDDMPDATAQETGGANAHVDAETSDAAPMPTDAAMPDGSSPDVADASNSAVPEMMDATPPDPCLTAACGDNGECVVEDNTAHCNCLRGYIKGALGCERDECQTLTDADPTTCGANASCEDPTAETEDFECSCNEYFDSCDGEEDSEPGCETNLQDDVEHCGACGYACAGDLNCIEGKCEQAANRLVLGYDTSCFLRANEQDGYEAKCTGNNNYFQVRLGGLNDADKVVDTATPTSLNGIGPVKDISLGAYAACAIPEAGQTVECWGSNTYLRRGHPTADLVYDKLNTIQLPEAEQVVVGIGYTCARTSYGAVYCWGSNVGGLLGSDIPGDPTPTATAVPQRVPDIWDAASITVGPTYACAIEATSRHVICWGAVASQGGEYKVRAPSPILAASGQPIEARSVSIGQLSHYFMNTACAVLQSKRVACWGAHGDSLHGRLPEIEDREDHAAVELPLENVADLAIALSTACALLDNGELHCWGEVDRSTNALTSAPTRGPELELLPDGVNDTVDVAAGHGHLCIRRRSGAVLCQGVDDFGQLGDGAGQADNSWQSWSPVVGFP